MTIGSAGAPSIREVTGRFAGSIDTTGLVADAGRPFAPAKASDFAGIVAGATEMIGAFSTAGDSTVNPVAAAPPMLRSTSLCADGGVRWAPWRPTIRA